MKSKKKQTYSVVLRSGIPERELGFLGMFGTFTYTEAQGELLLTFACTEISTSHHVYLEMKILEDEHQDEATLRVPHHYVLLIEGDESKPSVGF